MAASIYAATARWLDLIGEFDRREAYERFGFGCCSAWLAWRCSISSRTAREQVRVARGLRELPLVSQAFSRGDLSYSKVRALTRIREVRPGREADLLSLARHATAAQLDLLVRTHHRVTNDDAAAAIAQRAVEHHFNADGSITISARLPAEEASVVLKALDAAADELWRREEGESGSAEPVPKGRAPMADCLMEVVETYLDNPAAGSDQGESRRRRYQVVIEGGPPHIRGLTAISGGTLRRIACDSDRVSATDGRLSRTVPATMRRILSRRDPTCRFPGCNNRLVLDAHHIHHWADGGGTTLGNLVHLCRRHHRLVHELGWKLEGDPRDELVFLNPAGIRMVASPELPGASGTLRGAAGDFTDLSRGQRMNLGHAVEAMIDFCDP